MQMPVSASKQAQPSRFLRTVSIRLFSAKNERVPNRFTISSVTNEKDFNGEALKPARNQAEIRVASEGNVDSDALVRQHHRGRANR